MRYFSFREVLGNDGSFPEIGAAENGGRNIQFLRTFKGVGFRVVTQQQHHPDVSVIPEVVDNLFGIGSASRRENGQAILLVLHAATKEPNALVNYKREAEAIICGSPLRLKNTVNFKIDIQPMEYETFGTQVKRTTRKVFRIFMIVLVLGAAATFAFLYWGVYDDGLMAGKVLRISRKGVLFKTYEGKINLETFGALKGTSPIAESFDFSVEKDQEELIKQLQEVALSGERVNLYYAKRYVAFPWRGDTKYFVVRVERLGK